MAYQKPVAERYVATTRSTELAAVDNTPAVPPGHLNEVGQVIVRLPVASCVMNQLMVCPSFKLLKEGAVVTLAVNVVVKTLLREQSTAIAVAENVTATGAVWAKVNLPPTGVVVPIGPVGDARNEVNPAPLIVLDAARVVNEPVFGVVAPTVPLCGPENCTDAVAVVNAPVLGDVLPSGGGTAK